MNAEEITHDIIFVILFVAFSMSLGIIIYKLSIGLNWVDSYYNAALLLSGVGPDIGACDPISKILIGSYALYGALFLLILVAIILTQIYKLSTTSK